MTPELGSYHSENRQIVAPMTAFPTLFVSHGGPNIVMDDIKAHRFLKDLQSFVRKPSAIVINSAHFEAPGPSVVRDPNPGMIYDFGGFPEELYAMVYPAPGDAALADQVLKLLSDADLAPNAVEERGYDHGAWNPLILGFPDADIPVVQLSVDPQADAAWHIKMGRALAPLGSEGVLVMGSGHITHNLRVALSQMRGGPAVPGFSDKVTAFTDWFHGTLSAGDEQALAAWADQAPFVADNHPTAEHLMPIFTAYGAAGAGATGERIHDSTQYNGVFAWDAYRFS